LHNECIDILLEQLGPKHPKLAHSYHDLGKVYYRLGKYQVETVKVKVLTVLGSGELLLESIGNSRNLFFGISSRYCSKSAFLGLSVHHTW
jgi:hypothetical protein